LGEAGPKKILVLVGPGNNGGDGLVAARFLSIFGHKVSVHIPKITKFGALRSQCTLHGVNVIDTISRDDLNTNNDLIVDSIFGFGFKGEIREPYASLIGSLVEAKVPIISVDAPSGWPVQKTLNQSPSGLIKPVALISLTAPKSWIRDLSKEMLIRIHYLAGRFVPSEIVEKYALLTVGEAFPYKGSSMFGIIE
jgi:NAD(P)H-hydrate epimerase